MSLGQHCCHCLYCVRTPPLCCDRNSSSMTPLSRLLLPCLCKSCHPISLTSHGIQADNATWRFLQDMHL